MSENACGKASSGNSSADKEVTECPTCGRNDFSGRKGMKVHHKYAHGESLKGVNVSCHSCGETFRCSESRLRRSEYVYCSQECQHNGLQGRTGQQSPHYDRVEYNCDKCGKTMERKPSRVENYEFLYCSEECMYSHNGRNESIGEKNSKQDIEISCKECNIAFSVKPHRKERAKFCSRECMYSHDGRKNTIGEKNSKENAEMRCEVCSDMFSVIPAREERARFCSVECRHEFLRQRTGQEHPLYVEEKEEDYGQNWNEIAKGIREKYNRECWSCGVDESELFRKLDVHHIKPRREFDNVDEANTEDNLIPLCLPCHQKWESLPIRPQVSD